ncbi:uncharacterized protein DS421_14g447850 [Arachis hypogaea]|nr:uncharacterized protein DS421_14g447850 [Arachis hypogaea]
MAASARDKWRRRREAVAVSARAAMGQQGNVRLQRRRHGLRASIASERGDEE